MFASQSEVPLASGVVPDASLFSNPKPTKEKTMTEKMLNAVCIILGFVLALVLVVYAYHRAPTTATPVPRVVSAYSDDELGFEEFHAVLDNTIEKIEACLADAECSKRNITYGLEAISPTKAKQNQAALTGLKDVMKQMRTGIEAVIRLDKKVRAAGVKAGIKY
jgi:hypothetical protein